MSQSDSGDGTRSPFSFPHSLIVDPDLGGLSPTTPHPQPRRTAKSQKNSKLNGRITSEAGPSSKPTKAPRKLAVKKTATRARNRASQTDDDNSDVLEVVQKDQVEQMDADMADAEDEDIQMVDLGKGKKGATDSAALSPSANGKPATKGKGKGKGKIPAAKLKKASPGGDTIDVDAVQGYEELDNDIDDVVQRAILAHGGGTKKDKSSAEMARLQERLRLVSRLVWFFPW